MVQFALADLIRPVSRGEFETSLYQLYSVLGLHTSSWKEGAVVRVMTTATSIVLAAFSKLQAATARAGFLELAEGPWLDLVAHYTYGTDRIDATFATGTLTLHNAGGGDFQLDAEDLIFRNPSTNKTYRNVTAVTLGPSATVTIPIRATEAGSSSSALPGAITEMTTTLIAVTCTNALALVGRDAETDPQLRSRCSESLGALSPFGPWDAYASAVRNAKRADGTTLGVTRIRPVKDGYGNVTIYCATASGAVDGDVDDPTTDLGVAQAAITLGATPFGVNGLVVSADALPVAVTYEFWMYDTSGQSDAQVTAAINERLMRFIASQPIAGNKLGAGPGKVFVDAIRSTIAATLPDIFHVVVSSPAADVDVAANEVPVAATPTCTAIHQLPDPSARRAVQ